MKNSPKNFYNSVDKRKLGIDEVNALSGDVEQLQSDVTGIETTIGNADSGLIKQVNDLQTAVDDIDYDISRKADKDGNYPDMVVGNAEQLISTVSENNKTPYIFRTSGGSIDIGDREVDKLVGGTLAWNQMVAIPSSDISKSANGIILTDNRDGSYSLSGTATNYFVSSSILAHAENTLIIGHKYAVLGMKANSGIRLADAWSAVFPTVTKDTIFAYSNANNSRIEIAITVATSTAITGTVTIKPMLIDLTAMFGSTIADYIYSLETTQSGAGVAWFKNLFGADYYAFNAGQLMSVKTSSHDMVGFNAYDNSTGKAKLVGGMEYQITGTYTSISYSTGETLTPDLHGKFTPSASGELTVEGGNGTDTCVHLVWDGERDNEYEEYKKYSYALDPDLELRGIPKLDANNNLYYDGDTYESDGTVTRKYGIYTFTGSETWNLYNNSFFYTTLSSISTPSEQNKINSIGFNCSLLSNKALRVYIEQNPQLTTSSNMNDYFKNGTQLVYELATPTTETADAYTDPQIVDDFGTEEYVDSRTVQIPVGHDTMYQANLRAKLETAPNLPESNGEYLMKYHNGEASYQQYSSPVPEAPTTDGTYVLTCTVADGAATLKWIANT